MPQNPSQIACAQETIDGLAEIVRDLDHDKVPDRHDEREFRADFRAKLLDTIRLLRSWFPTTIDPLDPS